MTYGGGSFRVILHEVSVYPRDSSRLTAFGMTIILVCHPERNPSTTLRTGSVKRRIPIMKTLRLSNHRHSSRLTALRMTPVFVSFQVMKDKVSTYPRDSSRLTAFGMILNKDRIAYGLVILSSSVDLQIPTEVEGFRKGKGAVSVGIE
jgi:hypothetical protein